jgi:hypothetical protein
MNDREQEQRLDGPDVLDAFVFADDIPALKMAALDQARDLYGPDAQLAVERTGRISSGMPSKGKFCAHVLVRCLNFPEEDR